MTTLGKILVFVNLVLSLFIMALIVSTYIGRTDWQRAHKEVLADRDVAKQNAQAAINQAAQAEAQVAQMTVQAEKAEQTHAQALAAVQAQVARAQTEISAKDQQIAQLNINLGTARQELQGSQKEKEYLRDRVASLDKELNQANLHVQESDNARVDAEINL